MYIIPKHLRGETVEITIKFQLKVLDGTAAAKFALAVKQAIDGQLLRTEGYGPIVDTDGTVLGQWKAEHTKKKKEAA